MSLKISWLEVVLFKGFSKTRVKFCPGLNLLVGKNNSGKTSLLQAIYLGFDFLNKTCGISELDKKRAAKDAKLRGSTVRNVNIPFHEEAYISEGLKRRSRRENSTQIKIGVTEENINFMETATFPGGNLLIFSSDIEGHAGKKIYRKQIDRLVKQPGRFPLFIPSFAGVASREEVKKEEVIKYYIASGRSNEVLRNQLNNISANKIIELNEYLKDSFKVEFVSSDTKEIYLSSLYKEEGKEYDGLDISSAGSGFQQVLQILVYIVNSDSDIILIDEPDAHLHCELQNKLYDILLELVKDGKQIIVATHSQVFIKRALEKDDRLIVSSKQLENLKAIDEYDDTLKTLYEQGLIDEGELTSGGTSKIVSLEDSREGAGFKIAKEFLSREGIREPEYKIISNNGSDEDDLRYVAGKKKMEGISLKLFAIRDGDSLPSIYTGKIRKQLNKGNVSLVFLGVHEIENYLLNPTIISRTIKNKGIEIKPNVIKKILLSIISRKKDELQDKLLDSVEGKLDKYYRTLGIAYPDVSTKAKEISRNVRQLDTSKKLRLLPGKLIFKSLKEIIHTKHNVSISELDVARAFTEKEVPREFKIADKFFEP